MTINETREVAVRAIVAESKGTCSIAKAVAALAPAWGLGPLEQAALTHQLETNQPPSAATLQAQQQAEQAARAEADRQQQQVRVTQIQEARRYNEMRRVNPILAARYAAERGSPVHLFENPDDDGGPSAA